MKILKYGCLLINMLAYSMQAPQVPLPKPTIINTLALAQPATARFTRDGKKLVIGACVQDGNSYTGQIYVYDAANYGKSPFQFHYPYDTYAIDTDPTNTNNACIANWPIPAQICDITNGSTLSNLPQETQGVQTVGYSNDGKQLLFATYSGAFCVDVATAKISAMIMELNMRASRFKPTDNNVVAYVPEPTGQGNGHSTIYLQDVRAKSPAWKIDSELPVYGLAFNEAGDKLVAMDAWNFGLYDTVAGKLLKYLNQKGKPEKQFKPIPKNKAICYADSGKFKDTIFFGSTDGAQMVIFDIDSGKNLYLSEQTGQSSDVWQLDISPDGKTLVAPQSCGVVQIWDISSIGSVKKVKGWDCEIS